MPIFRLEGDKLRIAEETNLGLESHLENWLENSPEALAQEPLLWIGRQPSAADEERTIFPDLLGVDSEGSLVIVELKRSQAPREVVAQLLEYAAWASELADGQIHKIIEDYFEAHDEFQGRNFHDVFKDTFDIPETDEVPPLNRTLRLFIVAEEIPTRIARVCRFLRTSQGLDISCIEVSTFQTEAGERLVSMETKVGDEDIVASKMQRQRTRHTSHWWGDKPITQVAWEAVLKFTNEDPNTTFTLTDIEQVVSDEHPDFNDSRVRNCIRGSCVNFPSRRNYPIGEDRYWRVERGKYRLYNPEKDKM